MSGRGWWKAALATLVAVPVVGLAAPVRAAVDECPVEESPCRGDLTVTFVHNTGGPFGISYNFIGDSAGLVDLATDADPTHTFTDGLIDLGAYSVSATLPNDLYLVSASCDGPAAGATVTGAFLIEFGYNSPSGQPATCTVTVGDAAEVLIAKTVYGDGGTFEFEVEGLDTDVEKSINIEVGAGDPTTASTTFWVPVGTYSISEVAQTGWLLDGVECRENNFFIVDPAAVEIGVDDYISCEFVNVPGVTLELTKTFGDENSDVQAGFEASWTDEPITLGHEESATFTLPTGFHSLTELPMMGYAGFIACLVVHENESSDYYVSDEDGTVDFVAYGGDSIECEATNDPLPVVNIHKVVTADVSEGERTFTFSGDYGSATVVGEYSDSGDYSDGSLVGDVDYHAITETSATGGWELDSVECNGQEVLIEGDTFFPYMSYGSVYDCVVTNVRAVDVQKQLVSLVPTAVPGVYDAEWLVTVTNGTDETTGELELTDEFTLPFLVSIDDSYALDSDGNGVADWDGVSDTLLASGFTLVPGESDSWQVFATVELPANMWPYDLACPISRDSDGGGLENTATLRSQPSLDLVDEAWLCTDLPEAELVIEKNSVAGPFDNGDGTWTQQYEITVTNEGDGYGSVTVTELPQFGLEFEVQSISVDYGDSELVVTDWDGSPVWVWTNAPIGAGGLLTATVDVVFEASPIWIDDDEGTRECLFDDGEPLSYSGLYNQATLVGSTIHLDDFPVKDFPGKSDDVVVGTCVDGPNSNVLIDKFVTGHEYVGDDAIAVDFDIVVTNDAFADRDVLPGFYVMADLLIPLMPGLQVVGFELTGTSGFTELGESDPEPGPDADVALIEEELGAGLYVIGQVQSGSTHTYSVRLTYLANLDDGFLGECADMVDVITEEAVPGGALNLVLWASDGDFSGIPFFPVNPTSLQEQLATVVEIPGNTLLEVEGLNLSYDCVDLAVVEVDKTIDDTNGGSATPEDFEFLVIGADDEVERTLVHDTPVLIVDGDYTIVEDDADGYRPSMSCTAEPIEYDFDDDFLTSIAGESTELALVALPYAEITIDPSTWVTCDVLNTALSARLSVDKSDGDATAVAGGDPITYSFIVENQEGFLQGDATLVDELPEGWSWVPGSVEGCTSHTITGRTLECVIAEELLAQSGDYAEVSADAQVAADAASGDYENIAVVGSEAIPAPENPSCDDLIELVDEPVEGPKDGIRDGEIDPNFDCEITPVVREASMSATKTSNAVGPVAIGGSVVFTLTVTNQGPSTVLAGTTLVDDLPAGLNLISINAPGWTCNAVDPVVCEYGSVLAVGETAPAIQITTTVAPGASGTITNTGVFTGIVDVEEAPQDPADVSLAAVPVVVTATAVASAVAVIQVRSGGTIPETGADSLGWLPVASLLVGAGLFGLLLARRRRPAGGAA